MNISRFIFTGLLVLASLLPATALQRNPSGNGFTWSAVYDGFGRRLQTSQQTITGGSNSGSPLVTQSSYDPDVQFLELASTVNGVREWLVHGPDVDGGYGDLQGSGGVDAVANDSTSVATGVFSDIYGHAVATVSGSTVTWNTVRSSGYGPQPGTTALPLDGVHDDSTFLNWHGKYVDGTGFYYLGNRYYDPSSATFLSADPLGHAASMSLYDYCNGDPVNNFDPDGRLQSGYSSGRSGSIDGDAPNSFAFSVGDYAGAIRQGAGEGLQNGAGGDVDALTFGNVRGAFGSDVNSQEYLQGQIGGIVGRESLITAGTLGLGQLARGGSMAAFYGYRGATTIAAGRDAYSITEGSVRAYNGDNWGYLEAGLGGVGFAGNLSAFTGIKLPSIRSAPLALPYSGPVVIRFPAAGLTTVQQQQFAAHLAEQEATLNRLSLNTPSVLSANLLNYPNLASQIAAARKLARGYLPGSGQGLDAAHSLDSVAGGNIYEFIGFRDPIQQRIGALWRTRTGQIVPGRVHQLLPVFDDQ